MKFIDDFYRERFVLIFLDSCFALNLISLFFLPLAQIINLNPCRFYKVEDPVNGTISCFADRISCASLREVLLSTMKEGS